jgi:MalT-like TPR region
VLQALALQAPGHIPAALTCLERALTLAEPEGYVRIFVDEGPPIGSLLRVAEKQGTTRDYVRRLLAAVSQTGQDRFGSADTLRRHFARARGTTPEQYRRAFHLAGPDPAAGPPQAGH